MRAGGGAPGRSASLGLAALVAWAALAVPPAAAQQVRVSGTTTLQYVDVRPLATDSVPVEETRGDGLLRRSTSGDVVRCVEGEAYCRFVGSGEPVWTAPMMQDLRASAWGFGRGVRAYAHLRGRAVAGTGDELWPRSGDRFDLLAAYVELDRSRFRVRAGRQWKSSGLGHYNYDGAAALGRVARGLTVEIFGGRSLLRGAEETRTGEALAAVEPFAPDEPELLVGGEVRWRPAPARSVSLLYQREIRRDRKAIYAERLALDGAWRQGAWIATGSLEMDLALETVTEARLDGEARLGGGLGAGGFVRRYRPWFEAWTIWGAFSPVGFDEAGVRGWWRPVGRPASLELRTAWRRYPEAHAASTFGTYRDTGWRVTGVGSWTPASRWEVQGRLGADVGFGAAGRDGSLRVERRLGEDGWLAASALAFERLYEFRVTEGTVLGIGGDGGLRLGARSSLRGSLTAYFHRTGADLPEPDWSQVRASLGLRWVVGTEPVASSGGAR